MSEIEIISFSPNSPELLFEVIYTPRSSRRRIELPVVGTVLTKITALDCFTPCTSYRLSPAFIYENDIMLGEAYWDPDKDGREITVTPIKRLLPV